MFKLISPRTIAGALLALGLAVAPALAASPVTFVSGKGADGGTCASPANPCRSFQFAFGQTSPGGEIKALNPAPYGPVTIDKSISITGVEGASINRPSGDHITIKAGPNDTINLSHLILDGGKAANNGIVLNSGGSLTITHCAVRNFSDEGIRIAPTAGTATILIADVVATASLVGVFAIGIGTGTVQGTLDHVLAYKNEFGITAGARATLLAVDSSAINNEHGFGVGSAGVLRLAHSAATGNGTGLGLSAAALAESAGNNFINGNGTDVDGPLTRFATQ